MQEDDWPGVRCCFWLKSDFFFYLSQKFKHDLWRLKKKLKLSRKQHLTPVQNHSDTWHDTNRMQTKQWRHILSVKNSNEINCNCFINNDIMFVIRLGKKKTDYLAKWITSINVFSPCPGNGSVMTSVCDAVLAPGHYTEQRYRVRITAFRHKNKAKGTAAHTIASWPPPKQWLM